jgi:1-deoxy-D-xylulose-5-phosphate synthase
LEKFVSLLDQIRNPADLKKLAPDRLPALAAEIRQRIIEAVGRNGGHLASNLGVVELTIALHYLYDFGPFPKGPDRLLWDVGHQCYAHKMLTGRAAAFARLRRKSSVAGFPSPLESAYDLMAVGHAGTAVSTAVGLARADAILNRPSHVVAVVGDASIVNGLAFEGLNNAGTLKRQLLIVLNDNGMSISKPQGAFAAYLERVRISHTYDEVKRFGHRVLQRLPTRFEHAIESLWHHMKEGVKTALWPGQIFETLGLKYMGPVDGHDLPGMLNMLAELKEVAAPVLLHVRTVKGHGYAHAASEPTKFHSPAGFKVEECGIQVARTGGRSWTSAFAESLAQRMRDDPRIVVLTAAMPDGTGVSILEKQFPSRCFDAGICESHLTAMAAGMAKAALRPVVAVYSTFLQRAFDQVWQEITLNGLPVVLAMDRAGLVGDDGAVHHGFMDQAFLRPLPGIVLMAPSDEAEMRRAMALALSLDDPSAVRYPRDTVPATPFECVIADDLRPAAGQDWALGQSRLLRRGDDATIISYGALTHSAMLAADQLTAEGLGVAVVDARFCKPIDGAMLRRELRPGHPVLTLEDHALTNGFGSAVLEYAAGHSLPTDGLTRLGIPDRLVAHATRHEQLAELGLDPVGIARSVRHAISRCDASPSPDASPARIR